MIRVKDICKVLEEFAPIYLQESYDNCGLQIGDRDMELTGALLTTDVTEASVREAKENNCNIIIAHHPLIFRGLKQLTNSNYVEKIVVDCIKNNIAVYAAHTNFDKIYQGVSYRMAKKLQLTDICTLVAESEENRIGLGCIGKLTTAISTSDFLQEVKKVFGVKAIKHTKILKDEIQTVALCGGSGSEFISNAISAQADIYLTADISYHSYFETKDQIIIADIGHHESEKFTKEIFYEQLTNFFPNFVLYFADTDVSPVEWC